MAASRGRTRRVGGGASQPTPGSAADLQPEADPEQVARTILLRRLTAAPRTRAQLADDLASRGIADDVANRVLDRFEEVGLIDDPAFAAAWVTSRHTGRGLGRRALAIELRRKGVADELVADALVAVTDDDERATAAALVRRRLPSMQRVDRAAATRRLIGMLARRGYSAGLAAAVVSEVLGEPDTDAGWPLE